QPKAAKCRNHPHSIFVSGWYRQYCCRSFSCCSSLARCCTIPIRRSRCRVVITVKTTLVAQGRWSFLTSKERSVMEQESLHRVYRFDQNPSARAERLRKEARGTPHGVRRDDLLRRAQQIEGLQIECLPAVQVPLASPDPQSSK